VKTSLAPGSKSGDRVLGGRLLAYLEQIHFFTVGYGCTTCIATAAPCRWPVSRAIAMPHARSVGLLVSHALRPLRRLPECTHPKHVGYSTARQAYSRSVR